MKNLIVIFICSMISLSVFGTPTLKEVMTNPGEYTEQRLVFTNITMYYYPRTSSMIIKDPSYDSFGNTNLSFDISKMAKGPFDVHIANGEIIMTVHKHTKILPKQNAVTQFVFEVKQK